MDSAFTPDIRVEETISNPLKPAEVYGFVGRNTIAGCTAVVMKKSAVNAGFHGEDVSVPQEYADLIEEEDGELIVLLDDTVLVMQAEDFAVQTRLTTRQGGGQAVTMPAVLLDNNWFTEYPRSDVTISN